MCTIARLLGITSSVFIVIVGIIYIIVAMQENDKNTQLVKQGHRDYGDLLFFWIMVGFAVCVYGLWILLGAWLVTKHPIVAFFIFLIPGSIFGVMFLPRYSLNYSNLSEMSLAVGSLLNIVSCLTAFAGIWEKDEKVPIPPQ